ncbi:MAG: class I SAM-dependent methyltransferase [Phycisphaerae bacterium]|jgi:S-adenosylmethionine-diacylgycerolhomoserine-N-methlytransferase|nr:class I SAM-dependent methyltransferase [Phycisphaerae bacterium]
MNADSTYPVSAAANAASLARYYRFHSRIYNATRWSFLFGRSSLLGELPETFAPRSILEIGCGTGVILDAAARRFPRATLIGLDLSDSMLGVAERTVRAHGSRVRLVRRAYAMPSAAALGVRGGFDLIVTSYALSMFGGGAEAAIVSAHNDLSQRGRFIAVDFHDTPLRSFERWMGVNHVRMSGQLLPMLERTFAMERVEVRRAYRGLWRYFVCTGTRRGQ